eukprot:CAMPEP_0170103660 /NCGR_PEP_ID=MMETSP0020_2-20130122/3637_1 /TAXON_ID=98059 /ORGANISM="Dinobryon sp., Strain UTEXLB2267" /LENGTH=1243 /DNA_ID=CAMNT_0010327291 /DNA_START=886 /DNA_END=4617 /DNA_ORIENTATION=-
MLTVGYGDIHATNNDERAFAIATMLTGGILFGALLSKVTLLIDKRDPQAKAYKEKMAELRSYLDGIPLTLELKNEAKDAYSYFLHKKSSFGEEGILSNLPQPALVKLITQIYAKEIDRIKVFNTFDKLFVIELIKHMRPFQAKKGEELFNEGDVLNDIIFISIGDVMISKFNGMHQVLLGACQEGTYFGDFEYHKNTTSIASYRAATNCNLLAIAHHVINRATSTHLDAGREFKLQIEKRYEAFLKVVNTTMGSHMKADKIKVDSKYVDKLETEYITEDDFEVQLLYLDGELQPPERVKLASYNQRRNQANTYRVLASNGKGSVSVMEMEKSALARALIIHPKDYRKGYWDIFVGILILISVLIAPVDVAFSTNSLSDSADLAINIVFMIDIVVSFRTAFESKVENAFVVSPKHIAKRYLKTWFLIDVASSIPFTEIVEGNYVKNSLFKLLRLSRLLRVARMFKIKVYLSRFESLSGISSNVFDMLTLVLKVSSIGHIIACVWWGVCNLIAITDGNSWYDNVSKNGISLQNESTAVQYLWSLYWTIATLTTVGYGDVTASNTYERILNIFILLIGASVFGFIIANVSSILDNIDRKGSVAVDKITKITEYLRHKNCPAVIADSIVNHFRQVYSLQATHDGMELLADLPTNIKNKILLIQYRAKLEKIAIFRHVPNKSVCLYLFEMMNPIFYQPGHVIMSEGEKASEILFMVSGEGVAMKKLRRSVVPEAVMTDKRRSSVMKTHLSTFIENQMDEDDSDSESNRVEKNMSKSSRSNTHRNRASSKIGSQKNDNESRIPVPSDSQKNAFMKRRRGAMVGDNMKNFLGSSFRDSGHNLTNYLIETFSVDEMEIEKEEEKHDIFDDINSWSKNEHEMKLKGFSLVGKLFPGNFFGHVALLDQSTHRVSVVATSPTCVYSLSKLSIQQMIKIEPTVAMQFQNALSAAIRKQERKLGQFHAKEKKFNFLAKIKKQFYKKRGGNLDKSILHRLRRSSKMLLHGDPAILRYGPSTKVRPTLNVPMESLHPDLRESIKNRRSFKSSSGDLSNSDDKYAQSLRQDRLESITSQLNEDSDSDDSIKFQLSRSKSFRAQPPKKPSLASIASKFKYRQSTLTKAIQKLKETKFKKIRLSGKMSHYATQSMLLRRRWSMSDVVCLSFEDGNRNSNTKGLHLRNNKVKVGSFLGEWGNLPSNSRKNSRVEEQKSEMVYEFAALSSPHVRIPSTRQRRQSFPSLENLQWKRSRENYGLT